jgi:hypothetical protein
MNQNKKIALLTLVLALFSVSSNIFGQRYMCNDCDYGMRWWNSDLPSQYHLSSDQVDELERYREDFNQKIIPLQKELRALQIEMRGYVSRNDSDPSKVKEFRNQIRDVQDKIADIRIDARKKMSSVITEDQQIYINDSSVGWWNGLFERCGWDYGDMMYDPDYGYNGRSGHRRSCW